jgi:hypothetical protein
MPTSIPPPDNLSPEPDADTRKFDDYTGDRAEGRVLYIDLKCFKYGTTDKVHASSLVLSFLLLILTFVIYVVGFFSSNAEWARGAAQWFGGAFLFVAGIALGKAGRDHPNSRDNF